MNAVSTDDKLSVNRFYVDEGNAHIETSDNPNPSELCKLVKACPAGLYRIQEDGSLQFDYAGCLECGTCRILCGATILKKWEYPLGGFGVDYRYG